MNAEGRVRTATVVALCEGGHAGGIDISETRPLLSGRGPEVAMELVHDLCRELDRLPGLVRTADARRVVLGLCAGASSDEVQTWSRKAGLSPFAIEVVDLGLAALLGNATGAAERQAAALAGAVAAAETSVPPGDAVLRLSGGRVSRRALLSGGPVAYRPVATIEPSACLGNDRCGLCVAACPVNAIQPAGSKPSVTHTCEACGACVPLCPAGAISLPGATLPEAAARLARTLAAWRGESPGVLFACRGALGHMPRDQEVPSGDWLPVPVPCLSMVTPGWTLQALAHGARAVALLGCGQWCKLKSGERATGQVAMLDAVTSALGSAARAAFVTYGEPLAAGLDGLPRRSILPVAPNGPVTLSEPAASADALLVLAGKGTSPLDVRAASSPIGVVSVEGDRCTLCGLCAQACPHSALAFEQAEDSATLVFDGTRCVACDRCVDSCPENAVTVEPRVDLATLRAGMRELKAGPVARCARCRRPIAPSAMQERIQALLAEGPPGLVEATTLCVSCRGRG